MKWAASHLKISWILALLLLIGCLLGANHIMNGSGSIKNAFAPKREPPSDKSGARNPSGQRYSNTSVGVVASEVDVVYLAPGVAGEVVEVLAKTGDHVKRGQVLLRMDDRLMRYKSEEAESAVKAAAANVKMAKNALDTLETKRNMQVLNIQTFRLKRKAQQNTVDNLDEYKKKGINYSETDYMNAKLAVEALDVGIKVEEERLKEIDGSRPTVEAQVALAESSLTAAEAKRKSAKLGVEQCELKAPDDGTIMQSFVAVGTKFGEQGVRLAFQFYSGGLIVKADIPQEFSTGVKEGQSVVVEDAAGNEQTWHGHVYWVDSKFTIKRETGAIPGLPEQTQDPVLECRIKLDTDKSLPLLNQRVRVKFIK